MGTKLLSGNPNSIVVDMASAIACNPGDIVVLDIGGTTLGWPISNTVAHLTSLAAMQELAHDSFIGIALDGKVAGRAKPVRVATEGVFSIPIVAVTAAPIGTLYGIQTTDGDHGPPILDQVVIAVSEAKLAIGVLVKPTLATDTHAHIRIFSTKTIGGPQNKA